MSGPFWIRAYFRRVRYLNSLKGKGLGVLLVLFVAIGLLIYAKRKPREYFHYMGEIFADQAGYYVYLPATFIYDFDGSSFSDKFIESVGYGFTVDSISGKIITKYPVGVALMQAPFFGIIHAHTAISGGVLDGFSRNYHNVPNWAAWFYSSMGLWLFYLFLRERVQRWVCWLSMIAVFFGTSTYYYTADNSGMSHVYSFFLFSASIYVFDRVSKNGLRVVHAFWIGLICGLIVAVRPINIVFVPIAVFYLLVLNKKDWSWAVSQLSWRKVLTVIIMAFLMLLPQFLYWKYTSGSFVHYSYGEEGFSYWYKPRLGALWFAPLSGLFIYSPAYLLAIIAMFRRLKARENRVMLGGFLLFSYLISAWHIYSFGCSFGSRNFVEYSVLFFIPLAFWLNDLKRIKRAVLGMGVIVSTVFTMTIAMSYSSCLYALPWEWQRFTDVLLRGVYYQSISDRVIARDQFYSGMTLDSPEDFTLRNYRSADVHIKMTGYSEKTDVALVVSKDTIVQYSGFNPVQEELKDEKGDMYVTIPLGENLPMDGEIKVFVINAGRDSIYVDKLSVWLR